MKNKTQEQREAYNQYQRDYRKAKIKRHCIVKEHLDKLPNDAVAIPSLPTYYATPAGEIYRISNPRTTGFTTIPSRIIKLTQSKNASTQYYQVQPYNADGVRKLMYVHRLVLEAFYGVPEGDKTHCNHIDGNPANNHISNLEWCTRLHNAQNRVNPRGKYAHLRDEVLADYDNGMSISKILKKYNMKSSHHLYGWLRTKNQPIKIKKTEAEKKENQKQWYKNNRERLLEKQKQYQQNNKNNPEWKKLKAERDKQNYLKNKATDQNED